jgi:hypothetical protein
MPQSASIFQWMRAFSVAAAEAREEIAGSAVHP